MFPCALGFLFAASLTGVCCAAFGVLRFFAGFASENPRRENKTKTYSYSFPFALPMRRSVKSPFERSLTAPQYSTLSRCGSFFLPVFALAPVLSFHFPLPFLISDPLTLTLTLTLTLCFRWISYKRHRDQSYHQNSLSCSGDIRPREQSIVSSSCRRSPSHNSLFFRPAIFP